MQGVTYLVDEAGKRTSVILDLKRHSGIWKDLCDRLMIRKRRAEPRDSLQHVKARMARKLSRIHG